MLEKRVAVLRKNITAFELELGDVKRSYLEKLARSIHGPSTPPPPLIHPGDSDELRLPRSEKKP